MQELLVLGDSHIPIFNHPIFKETFPGILFNIVSVIGATASGLDNPNTKTQAYPIFKGAVQKSSATKVIVMLGEVDTGFVIWYRALKYQESISAMTDRAVTNYSGFLTELKAHFEVICISTPLPTIRDGNDWGEVANARSEVTVSQYDRTALTLRFNLTMQAFCEQNDIRYLMFDEESLGENGLVKQVLLNSDPSNHHYDPDQYSRLLTTKLIGVI